MTEYGEAIIMALAYLEKADTQERIYFLDTLHCKYCQHCGEARETDNALCSCWIDSIYHNAELRDYP